MTAYVARSAVHPNRKDSQPRPRSTDTIGQFLDAGFRQSTKNPHVFYLESYGYVFRISPATTGLKVQSDIILGRQLFGYGTSPDVIADWIIDYAHERYQTRYNPNWMTENLPPGEPQAETVPGCYGLGKGVDYA